MFNFHSVNTAEVNAGSRPPEQPVLSILVSEDVNTLSWTSSLFTDFFEIYWGPEPFTNTDDPGVRKMSDSDANAHFGLGSDPSVIISYPHVIPAVFGLSILYYRVDAYNRNSP